MNYSKRWNLLISYNPNFVETYYKALYYIGQIKNSLSDDDLLSLFSYKEKTLKRSVNKKLSGNIDLDESLDSFLNVRFDGNKVANETNFIERFKTFLKGSHQTDKMLRSNKFKNLVIAFTSEEEWEKSEFDEETIEFIENLEMKDKNLSESDDQNSILGSDYELVLMLIVFKSGPCLKGNTKYSNK
jgi:hypothetical protein